MISASAFAKLYVTEPMLLTIRRNGAPCLWIFGMLYIQGVSFAVGIRWL